jgi:hypothetical protein
MVKKEQTYSSFDSVIQYIHHLLAEPRMQRVDQRLELSAKPDSHDCQTQMVTRQLHVVLVLSPPSRPLCYLANRRIHLKSGL